MLDNKFNEKERDDILEDLIFTAKRYGEDTATFASRLKEVFNIELKMSREQFSKTGYGYFNSVEDE